MIESELDRAIEFLDLIDAPQAPPLSLALWHAAIMSYGRCFASTRGRGTKLELEHVLRIDKTAGALHKKITSLRDEYVAHAGKHSFEHTIVAVSLAPHPEPRAVQALGYGQVFTMGPSQQELNELMHISRGLKQVVSEILASAEEKLLTTFKQKDIVQLYQSATI